MKRSLLAIPLVALFAGCRGGSADASAPASTPVSGAAAIASGDAPLDRLVLTGELRAVRSVALATPRTRMWQLGIRWMIEDGTFVRAGDKVLEFDNSALTGDLDQKRLAVREAALALENQAAQNALADADKRFEVERKKVLLEKAELLASVAKDLLPERTWQERQLGLERARVDLHRAEVDLDAHLKASTLDLAVRRVALEKAQRELDSTEESLAALTLSAPRDGLALAGTHPWEQRKFQVGDATHPGWTVVEIPDLSEMEVEAQVSDVDDGWVAPGAKVTCTLDAYPAEPLEGTVVRLSPMAAEAEARSLRRGFTVRIALANTDAARMRPGMSVKVEVPLVARAERTEGAPLRAEESP